MSHSKLAAVLVTFWAGLIFNLVSATDLNAPAQKPVTVRSEIERGLGAVEIDGYLGNPQKLEEQVRAILKKNQQANSDTPGFQFGVNYRAWHILWSCLSSNLYEPPYRDLAEALSGIYFMIAHGIASNQLQLTDDQVREVVGIYYVRDEETLFPEILKSKRFSGTFKSVADERFEKYKQRRLENDRK